MDPHPRLSRTGIELVKRFEGLRRKAARLERGGWTLGYGHTLSAREGAEVDAVQAEALLTYDLDRVAKAIDPLIFSPLTDNQFNALTAFAFNIGLDNFRHSSVLKRVNEGAPLQAAAALELWRRADFYGDSLVVDGLVRRRAAEKALFLTPTDGERPVPTPVVRPVYDAGAADLRAVGRGLTEATELHVALEGESAHAELAPDLAPDLPPVQPVVEEAARNVTARLQALYPEAEPAPPPPPELKPEPEPPAPEPVSEPEPPPPPPLPEAVAPPPRLFELPEVAAEPPPVAEPWVEPVAPEEPPHPELPMGDYAPARPMAVAPPETASIGSAYLVLVAGAVGAMMFIGALLAMIYGRATLVNLGIGLIGVVAMVPASLRLLLRLFGERND